VFEGERAVVIGERDSLTVQVNCAADAGGFEASIPYALAVTLEVARPLGVSIYDQIRDRIRPRVEITPQPSR
jgi:prophage tail gpP-like protein